MVLGVFSNIRGAAVDSIAPNEESSSHSNAVAYPSTGKIKWFNAEKGYGFIMVPELDTDIFLHVKELRKSGIVALIDGTTVSFVSNKGVKGLYATDIKVLSPG